MIVDHLTLYSIVKIVHVSCAVISIIGFAIRALMKLSESAQLNNRWMKITPHVIDTVLLASAVFLALSSHQYPLQNSWLSAKVFALIMYIAMGFVAMRIAKNKMQQLFSVIVALLIAGYIFAVALSRDPTPF